MVTPTSLPAAHRAVGPPLLKLGGREGEAGIRLTAQLRHDEDHPVRMARAFARVARARDAAKGHAVPPRHLDMRAPLAHLERVHALPARAARRGPDVVVAEIRLPTRKRRCSSIHSSDWIVDTYKPTSMCTYAAGWRDAASCDESDTL